MLNNYQRKKHFFKTWQWFIIKTWICFWIK